MATEPTIKGRIAVETDPDQSWFWTEEWLAGEREADAQIAVGAGTFFEHGGEFLRALDPHLAA